MLKEQGASEAAKVMGGRGRLQDVLDGKSVSEVFNEGRPKQYWVQRAGEAGGRMPLMLKHQNAIPNAEEATISIEKLSGYSLSKDHEKGRHKA